MILILMPMSFVACSDDDDDDVDDSGSDDVDDSVSIADDGYEVSGTINGHYYVDLGLSVKWADRNVSAWSSGACGAYFAWGETKTKDEYTSSNSLTDGVEMDDIAGDAEYDAATANWGSKWRLPTKDEFEELVKKCTWTWTQRDSLNGYLVIGPNANSIFLPAADCYEGAEKDDSSIGYYWSSTPIDSDVDDCFFYAYFLWIDSGDYGVGDHARSLGFPVRPVSDY